MQPRDQGIEIETGKLENVVGGVEEKREQRGIPEVGDGGGDLERRKMLGIMVDLPPALCQRALEQHQSQTKERERTRDVAIRRGPQQERARRETGQLQQVPIAVCRLQGSTHGPVGEEQLPGDERELAQPHCVLLTRVAPGNAGESEELHEEDPVGRHASATQLRRETAGEIAGSGEV